MIQNSVSSMLSKEEGKYQESIQSDTTPDPTPYGKETKTQLDITTREPRGQPFPSR